jgi:thymidylate synthase
MYIAANTFDDLLAKVFRRLLTRGLRITPTKGPASELSGVLLCLNSPRARLSRTETRGVFFSCLGELLWYLNGSNRLDFIEYYIPRYKKFSDDKETLFGAYGPRIFGKDRNAQIFRAIDLLREKPDSRQAVVQIFDRADLLDPHLDIPCTSTLQFTIRNQRLNLLVSMRSNDAYKGLAHDVFSFTMIQELVAKSLGLAMGRYKHCVGSLHLYDGDHAQAIAYLNEGMQPRVAMPPMPDGNPWLYVDRLLNAEQRVRAGDLSAIYDLASENPYWGDLARLLGIFTLTKAPGNGRKILRLKHEMESEAYALYIRKRIRRVFGAQDQLPIFDSLITPLGSR